jgi:cathepsin L
MSPERIFSFVQWMAVNNKSYENADEFKGRFKNFMKREKFITEHNKAGNNYTVGHNSRSDWTDEEWKSILTYVETAEEDRVVTKLPISNDSTDPINWVTKGMVNAVQDQGQCGSCWAFGSLQSVENRHAVATGDLLKFSEQHLVDCVTSCNGCNGGMEKDAYEHFENHDTMSEASYPYTAADGACTETDGNGIRTTGNVSVQRNNPDAMKEAL